MEFWKEHIKMRQGFLSGRSWSLFHFQLVIFLWLKPGAGLAIILTWLHLQLPELFIDYMNIL